MGVAALLWVLMPGCVTNTLDPEFGDEDSSSSGDGDEDSSTSGNGDENSSGDGDEDPSASGDGDEEPNTSDTDGGGGGSCSLPFNTMLNPMVGAPGEGACAPELATYVRARPSEDGNWRVVACDEGCANCEDSEQSLGAPELELANLLPPESLGPLDSSCYYLEAEMLVEEEPEACVYASLSLSQLAEGGPGEPLFAAIRDNQELTAHAFDLLGGWGPGLTPGGDCHCDSVSTSQFSCCDSWVQLYLFEVPGVGTLSPGESASVDIQGLPYTFIARAGSRWGTCGQHYPVSWALVRE